MDELLRKLGIHNSGDLDSLLEQLEDKQIEYLNRLDVVEDEDRRMQLEADLKEIEATISNMSWMTSKKTTGIRRDIEVAEPEDEFAELKNLVKKSGPETLKAPEQNSASVQTQAHMAEEQRYDAALSLLATPQYQEGINQLIQLGNEGYYEAQMKLGEMYLSGNRVKEDEAEGLRWYRLAAADGPMELQRSLGDYLYNVGHYDEAAKWYEAAASQGDVDCQFCVANMYIDGADIPCDMQKGLYWLEQAAMHGKKDAQLFLGLLYDTGKYIAEDASKAFYWLEKAALQGDSYAQNQVGLLYTEGKGVAQDYAEAYRWYKKAAEQGDKDGLTNMAIAHFFGQGVANDYFYAAKLCRQAAEQGQVDACRLMGECYRYGRGVEQSDRIATFWYQKAADMGNRLAVEALEELRNKPQKKKFGFWNK